MTAKATAAIAAIVTVGLILAVARAEGPYPIAWATQIGTDQSDRSYSVAVDSARNAYISGKTLGGLGATNAGREDAFLSKFDSDGNLLWTTQFGTSGSETGGGVATGAVGHVYVSGYTNDDLGGPNAGGNDALIVKYEVPEPATLGLLALGGLAVLKRRRRQ